jgi:hypothetical protein
VFIRARCFYGEVFLTPSSTLKLENHPLLALPECLFSIFADLHYFMTCQEACAIVTLETCPLNWKQLISLKKMKFLVSKNVFMCNNAILLLLLLLLLKWLYSPMRTFASLIDFSQSSLIDLTGPRPHLRFPNC